MEQSLVFALNVNLSIYFFRTRDNGVLFGHQWIQSLVDFSYCCLRLLLGVAYIQGNVLIYVQDLINIHAGVTVIKDEQFQNLIKFSCSVSSVLIYSPTPMLTLGQSLICFLSLSVRSVLSSTSYKLNHTIHTLLSFLILIRLMFLRFIHFVA